MNNNQLAQGLEEIIREADEISKKAYSAKAELEICKQRMKNIIPVLASQHEGSEATKERLAKSSDDYKKVVKLYQAAEQDYAIKWSAFAALELKLSAYQTLNKIKNAEMQTNNFRP